MVETRSGAKTIKSGQAHSNDWKRRRGKPGEICQLNLDVLFLIAAYIHPIDLLNLARTCKSLRALLMDKSSVFVWKSARRQVKGLPDCPPDLTEPEYANLVFYARCHGCGKYVKTVFWEMRRRYCPSCRMRSFMDEYERTSDKKQFLSDRQKELVAILRVCLMFFFSLSRLSDWLLTACTRMRSLAAGSGSRAQNRSGNASARASHKVGPSSSQWWFCISSWCSIFERLKQHGYNPEVAYFGHYEIQKSRKSLFRTSKPLTDKEWDRIWPEWLETMNNFRSRRLENVYQSRRRSLMYKYDLYTTRPSPNTPVFDLLPHVVDVARFPPFRDTIRAPEETQTSSELFESAFAEIPALVDQWRKTLDAEIAELIKIPSHLFHTGCFRCVFYGGCEGIFTHPEVLSTVMRHYSYPNYGESDLERTGSIGDRFGIRFVEEAPYIVHACGLDPNVATSEDMDRRNARLKCLSCQDACIRSWRDALRHVQIYHKIKLVQLSELPRWQIVSDEHMGAIHAVELSVKKELAPEWARCLLCRPRVGDAKWHRVTIDHLIHGHDIEEDDIKRGVHWAPLGMHEVCSVEMVEEGGQVTFKEPRYEVFR
ncbi:hypothetical protein J3R83DRAFT_2571 [Lanmaoa asiatica]|nr:hypothetical protein J3R83DRAFT_2571 [Lanmaoa asiatica]